ncbi:MAG: hypothetical protein F6K48_32330 [Okeania sp. SIO3H1]|uniref:hypothetical protein n=1 Tax=Okeania sp. SIO1I7 TaxID=2607772 RepID=UPI0013CA51A0|nr:hypothetical protein [Okeania sp. SIO1I7]NEN93320.1 hypothetical protein [Okeania sp. SIO3H1]NET30207.1 hypothetical protein [Okeania sp. SIO1I7]
MEICNLLTEVDKLNKILGSSFVFLVHIAAIGGVLIFAIGTIWDALDNLIDNLIFA